MNLAIIDFNRTIYDPETGALVIGAKEGLETLSKKGIRLVLVSRQELGRNAVLKDFGIDTLFTEIIFVYEKSPELFSEIIKRHGDVAKHAYVIGDYLPEEIYAGMQVGAKTIHLKRGRFSELMPEEKHDEPWRTARDWKDVLSIISENS